MALEDFRAKAYVANINAGKIGGYLESGKGDIMETTVVAAEKTPEQIRVEGLLSARFHAHALEMALHLAYWRTESEHNVNYHKQDAKAQYDVLTEEMRKAGIIE